MTERVVASTVRRLGFKKGDMSIHQDAVRPPIDPGAVAIRGLVRELEELRNQTTQALQDPVALARIDARRDEILLGSFLRNALEQTVPSGIEISFSRSEDQPLTELTITVGGEGLLSTPFRGRINREGRTPELSALVGAAIKRLPLQPIGPQRPQRPG